MISIGSDNLITLSGLVDNTNSTYINNATVNGTLYTNTGTSVTTFSFTYVSASNGNYRGTIPASVTNNLTLGNEYQIKVVATASGTTLVLWKYEVASNTPG